MITMKYDIPILGIDLGTTNSAIAVWDPEQKRAVLLPNKENDVLTPSVVAFDAGQDTPLVGKAATEMMLVRPEDVDFSAQFFLQLRVRAWRR